MAKAIRYIYYGYGKNSCVAELMRRYEAMTVTEGKKK